MRTIGELLGLHWEQIDRAQKRHLTNSGGRVSFRTQPRSAASGVRTSTMKVASCAACIGTLTQHALIQMRERGSAGVWVRTATSSTGGASNTYDTNQQMLSAFYATPEYTAYIAAGGKPISESIFFQEKCKCVTMADNEECACPICTQMHELLRDWHRQRKSWHTQAGNCSCGMCDEGSAYRKASESTHRLNEFLLCGQKTFPSLQFPNSTEDVKLRRRQCCRAPLLASHIGGCKSDRSLCKDACEACGWEQRMPVCLIENSAADPAEWKEYRPRGPSTGAMAIRKISLLCLAPATR